MKTGPLTLLYDESCPLCRLEMNNLRARDDRGLLAFVDVSAPDFDVDKFGVPLADLMSVIHAVKADGTILKGAEVLRLAYGAVGLGWLFRPTGWPLLQPIFDCGYVWLANHRQVVSKKFDWLLIAVAAHRANRRARACKEGRCEI